MPVCRVALVFLLSICLAGCQKKGGTGAGDSAQPDSLAQIKAAGVLRVGTDPTFPPFESKDPNSQDIVGFDMDLLKAIAAEIGVKAEIIASPFDAIIPGLSTKKWDAIVSAMTITEERAKQVDFSNPYYLSAQAIIVRNDNSAIHGEADLKGKTLGVQLGTTGETEANKITGAKVIKFDTGTTPFDDLLKGKVDAVIMDRPAAVKIIKVKGRMKIVGKPLTAESYGIAVRKGDSALLNAINTALRKLKDSGQLAALESKWLTK
ncbi:MAG: basic amino acid ABC transporter substrate-binding protein [bacterium]